MALEPNNTALEFEMMLRRHLKRGGGPVAACAGFDADTASAYLEGALIEKTQARYETHLAGCPACRRQMIELSRLSLLALPVQAPVAPPWPVADTWWMTVSRVATAAIAGVKKQLDLSNWQWANSKWANWRWDWRIAGMAATACAVLAAVFVTQPWRQFDPTRRLAANSPSAPAAGIQSQATEADNLSPSPTPASDSLSSSEIGNQTARSERGKGMIAVPAPPKLIGPATPSPAASQDAFTAISRVSQDRQTTGRTGGQTGGVLPAPPPAFEFPKKIAADLAVNSLGIQGPLRSDADAAAETVQLNLASEPVMAPRIAPSSDDNPMRSIALRERQQEAKTRSDKSSSAEARPGWYDRVMGFMPAREPAKQVSKRPNQDDETINPLTRKLRDKSFRFDRGMWVDQSYKPEIMAWRVVRLTRNSKEYERLLAAEPQLREFFSLGPIIIVWRDKVYRVMGQ